MPEIKNTFTKGKMNLDLDERLVPKGEYKEALNVQVSTSDESDVGTVQNTLGNTSLESIITDTNYQCVGSISDEKNNRLFWFITNDTDSAIIEYNVDTQATTPILVDLGNSVLEFNTGNQITGINVVNDFLFWTDGENEPKKINIEEFRNNAHTDLTIPSGLYANGQRVLNFIETFTTDIFDNTTAGKDTFILTDVGTSDNKSVKVGDVLYSLETGNDDNLPDSAIGTTFIQTAVRTVTAVDYATSEVTLSSSIYNGTGRHYIGNKIVFTREAILKKEDITVIKRRPTQALRMELVPLGEGVTSGVTEAFDFTGSQTGDSVTIQIELESFVVMPSGTGLSEDYIDIANTTTPAGALTSDLLDGIPLDIAVDDILLLSDPTNPGVLPNNAQVILLIDSISYSQKEAGVFLQTFTCTIISIDSNTPPNSLAYDYQLQDLSNKLFDKSFPRFSYRYKYQDGEYSAFGPFTQVAFLPGQFSVHATREPYNSGMETRIKEIILKDFVPHDIPKDVVEVDLLYKSDDSTVVYSIATVRSNDSEWTAGDRVTLPWDYHNNDNGLVVDTSNSGSFTIKSNNIHAALPSNQLLRPWDNVPKKAKAQDFTANRLIYGNYTQNLKLGDYINKLTLRSEQRKVSTETIDFEKGKESVKSARTYQAGIVFGDEYGRETPVLTGGENSSFYLRHDASPASATFNGNASRSNRLYFRNYTGMPGKANWATEENEPYYFKVFIKETATEYYNLVMDRVYRAEEDGNLWISFPSSDRNKLQEDDYITLKKSLESSDQVAVENKFKVIDIQNSAPDFIRKKYKELGQADGNGTLTGVDGLYNNGTLQPYAGGSKLQLNKESLEQEHIVNLQDLVDNGEKLSISFSKENSSNETIYSKRYHITALTTTDSSPSYHIVVLDKGIVNADSWVESSAGVLDTALKTNIWLEEKQDWEEFQGRFFVKIISDLITDQYLEPQIGISVQNNFVARLPLHYLGDEGVLKYDGSIDYSTKTLVVNTDTDATSVMENTNFFADAADVSDTQSEWDDNLSAISVAKNGWFIDSAFTISQQPTVKASTSVDTGSTDVGVGDGWTHNSNVPGGVRGANDVSISGSLFKAAINRRDGRINSMQGIISTENRHTSVSSGALMWRKQPGGGFTEDGDVDVYGNTNGVCFMHLSFSGVGGDLMSGVNDLASDEDTSGSDIKVIDVNLGSMANYNQQPHNGTHLAGNGTSGGNTRYLRVLAEKGNYDSNTLHTFGVDISNLSEELGDRQWDPTYNHPENEDIVNNLVAGSKFKLKNNTIDTVFTIKSVTIKHLYNHTAWNRTVANDGGTNSNYYHINTVGERWKIYEASIDNSNGYGNLTKWEAVETAVRRFAKPDNRRVCYILELDKDPTDLTYYDDGDQRNIEENLAQTPGGGDSTFMEFFQAYVSENSTVLSDNPAIWETEPKEETGLDIYYEASDAIPIRLDTNSVSAAANSYDAPDNRKGYMIAPVGSLVRCSKANSHFTSGSLRVCRVEDWDGDIITLNPGLNPDVGTDVTDFLGVAPGESGYMQTYSESDNVDHQTELFKNKKIKFFKDNLSYVELNIDSVSEIGDTAGAGSTDIITKLKLSRVVNQRIGLPYFNCYSFGNGVESNRIRDDFNKPFISNGVKASSTLQEQYLEDHRSSGLIYSGLYNKNTSLNDLNQFIMAEKITKELLPTYGSIQKLFARNDDLIAFCEDKIVQIAADKDIIFNADGNPQLTASNKVLGQSRPFVGEYGISKNPESFASSSYRAYFTDKQRGAVLRLSKDGLTPISDAGMKDWFRDKLKGGYFDDKIIGSYDQNKECYNLTFDSGGLFSSSADFKDVGSSVTVTYKEDVKGWVSFKSFVPESGVSCVNTYFTFREGKIWEHNQNDTATRNTFYGGSADISFITAIFNDEPTTIKQFNTLNYDGTDGWDCDSIITDIEEATVVDFVNKENKYFASIVGNGSTDASSFEFQGIGTANSIN